MVNNVLWKFSLFICSIYFNKFEKYLNYIKKNLIFFVLILCEIECIYI